MLAADYIVDIGPGAGVNGGRVMAAGTPQEVMANPQSLTGQYLSGAKHVPLPACRRAPAGWLHVRGARANNLKNIDVDFPLGVLCCVTGVSGSGKSSLVNEILFKSLQKTLNRARSRAADHDEITGAEQLDKIIQIDQSPIGRSPRSNPATYTGLFDLIREVFRQHARCEGTRLQGQPLQLQCQGRALRGVLGRRHTEDRNAVPERRICALRGLPRHALQPRDAGGALQG